MRSAPSPIASAPTDPPPQEDRMPTAATRDQWLYPRRPRDQFPPYDFGDPGIVGQAEARTSTLARIYHKGHEQAWDGRTVMDEVVAKHGGRIDFPEDKK